MVKHQAIIVPIHLVQVVKDTEEMYFYIHVVHNNINNMLSNFKQICTKLNIQRMHMEKETAYAYGKKWYHPASC